MSVLNNSLLLGADAGGYTISRSLRFNAPDSAYLSRTPASAGNRKTWTWAGWVKKTATGVSLSGIFGAGSSTNYDGFIFGGNNVDTFAIGLANATGNANDYLFETTQVFRDTSAWYHLVVALNTSQSTASNRLKIYINGSEITAFSGGYPAQDYQTNWINTASLHNIGSGSGTFSGSRLLNAYLTDIHFIDGQALTPTSFGEFSATTGVWMPKAYTGSYGTNGFRLTFADNSAATATTLGKDAAGSNNWTPNNLSVTAGAGNDSLVDVPTNGSETDTGAGGQVRGNYCTFNPLVNFNSSTLSNGNLDITCTTLTGQWRTQKGGWGFYGGKYYFEVTVNATGSAGNAGIGIGRITLPHAGNTYPGQSVGSYAYTSDGGKVDSGSVSYPWATYTTGDVIGVAVDLVNGTVEFRKNNALQGSMTGISTSETYEVLAGSAGATAAQYTLNAGARPFAYTAPSGFKALCTANLPAPTIVKPSTVFDVKLYTGNGSSQSISTDFSPDFIWVKERGVSQEHRLYDIIRNTTKLSSNDTAAENTLAGQITGWNASSFTVGAGSNGSVAALNESGRSYAAWTWDAGSSTVTNTQGSITSSVRANATAGFSIVTWTGNGTNGATVGHGLGVKPHLVIYKNRSASTNWPVISDVLLGEGYYLYLNSVQQKVGVDPQIKAPTSSVLTLSSYSDGNGNGNSMVAYCFAPVAGYSSFGSYTGNGSADGPFVYTGFRPRFVLFKRTDSVSSGDWVIYDSARDPYNVCQNYLLPNTSGAEGVFANVDYLSNGFKLKSTGSINTSGGTWIYAAFAESPFQYARAR